MWTFEVLSAICLGFEIVTRFAWQYFDFLQCLLCGIPVGIILQTWFLFFASFFVGLNEVLGIITTILFFSLALIMRLHGPKSRSVFMFYISPSQFWCYFVFGLYFFIQFYSTMLYDNKWTKGAAYSDIPFHSNIMNSLVLGINSKRRDIFNISFLIYAGEKLAYPIVPDFYSASLMSTGVTCSRYAVFAPALIMGFSLIGAVYSLSFWFAKDYAICAISMFLFCNLGGLAWQHIFDPARRGPDSGNDWIHMWNKTEEEYWFHPLNHILIPQRSALWSMPLCYWTLLLLAIAVKRKDFRAIVLAGLLTGLMPQVQVHSYVAIAEWAIIYALVEFEWSWKYFRLWACYGLIANIIAFPQLIPYVGRVTKSTGSFLQWNPIWNGPKETKDFCTLWWRGLGPFAVIAIALGWIRCSWYQAKLYICSFGVFLIANFIRYQPWELDNTKIFYAAWIPFAVPVVAQYLKCLAGGPFGVFLAGLIIFASSFSSLINVWQVFFFPCPVYWKDDYLFGLWIAENTPIDKVFVSHGFPNDPVASLGGRQLFLGYPGWIDSHGLLYAERWNLIDLLIANPNVRELADNNSIEYVVDCVYGKRRTPLNNPSPHIWRKIFQSPIYNAWRIVR